MTTRIDAPLAVVVGSFTPSTFHPSWLAARWLVSDAEATTAVVQQVDPSCARFRCGWLSLEVTPGRLRAEAADEASSVLVRDFVVGVLTSLEHTPVTACGINRSIHLPADSPATWARIGRRMVPESPFGASIEESEVLSLTVRGRRPDRSSGRLQVRVEPSALLEPGICIDFNEHFEFAPGARSAARARDLLLDQWEPAQLHFLTIANGFLQGLG